MTWRHPRVRRARAATAVLAVAVLGLIAAGGVTPVAADPSCSAQTCLLVNVVDPDGNTLFAQTYDEQDFETAVYDLGQPNDPQVFFDRGMSIWKTLNVVVDSQLASQASKVDLTLTGDSVKAPLSEGNGDLAPANSGASRRYYEVGQAPAFYYQGGHLAFHRPRRAGEPAAGPDPSQDQRYMDASAGHTFVMTVYSEVTQLRPTLTVDKSNPKLGEATSFTVKFDGPQPSADARYYWVFPGDGRQPATQCPANGAVPDRTQTHRWAQQGNPTVIVGVCEQGQSRPVTATRQVTVGPKPTPTNTSGAGGGNADRGPGTGLGNKSGSNANGSTAADGQGLTMGATGQSAAAAAAAARRGLSRQQDGATSVTGLLLASDRSVPLAVTADPSSPVAVSSSRRPGEIPRDWRWLLGLLPVVLLAGGMVRQTRWLAPRLPQPPWRTS